MHGRGDMDLTISTYSLNIIKTRCASLLDSAIVLSDKGDEDEDDTGRLSELIALAEASLPAEEAEDDTGRLSELIALAEVGL